MRYYFDNNASISAGFSYLERNWHIKLAKVFLLKKRTNTELLDVFQAKTESKWKQRLIFWDASFDQQFLLDEAETTSQSGLKKSCRSNPGHVRQDLKKKQLWWHRVSLTKSWVGPFATSSKPDVLESCASDKNFNKIEISFLCLEVQLKKCT